MSYHDPYYNGQSSLGQHHHNSSTDFNPYSDEHNTYQDTSQNSNYTLNVDDDMGYPPRHREAETHQLTVEPVRRIKSGFEQGEFTPQPEKSLRGLKSYRHEHRGNLLTKGGRGRCIGRFCCCAIMTAVLLIVSILLTLALWIRPPNVTVGNVDLASNNPLQINAQEKELSINLQVNISVSNPNYFAISFQKIAADIFYSINNTHLGGGELKNVLFRPNQQTNITFPFSLDYNASDDPQYKVLLDLSRKCGVIGGTQSDITVKYKLTLGLRALFFVVSPVVSNSVSFACPASTQQIEDFLKGLGLSNLIPTSG
ncbi:hypothetical protein AX15_006308 [Amanita polypyramis BW_CC]|nr:hypothetical protein AX15_006308 [Amanita polypyramis BW_CC]